jgi:hypothetical protein
MIRDIRSQGEMMHAGSRPTLALMVALPLIAAACKADVSYPATCPIVANLAQYEGTQVRLLGSVDRHPDGSHTFRVNCRPPARLALQWGPGVEWSPGPGEAAPLLIVTGVVARDSRRGPVRWRIDATGYVQAPMIP